MAEIMTARAQLVTNMRFDAESGSGHAIPLDEAEQNGGQNLGFRPMELFLIGLAGCTGMEVLSLLRRQGQQVTAYEIAVIGKCADGHPIVFTEIIVEHTLTGQQLQPGMVAHTLQLSAERSCGTIPGSAVPITHTYRILYPSFGGVLIGCRHFWRQTDSQHTLAVQPDCDMDVREAGISVS